jgi:cytochrome c-type biogenesis protein CcmH
VILAFLLAVLAFAAALPIVLPLLRGARPAMDRAAFDTAVYRDQLRELDRDMARGLVTEAEAQGARLEIQRRLLAADAAAPNGVVRLDRRMPDVPSPPKGRAATSDSAGGGAISRLGPAGRDTASEHVSELPEAGPAGLGRDSVSRAAGVARRGRVLAGAVFVLIAGGSVGLYTVLGSPGIPDVPYAARTGQPRDEQAELRKALAQLQKRLKSHPDDAETWIVYGRANAILGRWGTAADAYRRGIDLGRKDPDTLASLGEVLVVQADGSVTPAARAAFEAARAADPRNGMSRFYLALAAGQDGDPAGGIAQLQALAADLPVDAPVRASIGEQVARLAKLAGVPPPGLPPGQPRAAPGPDADAVAAASQMPEADRKTMIAGMVARLAEKLAAQPDDPDGWMRLGRAYQVMGEAEKAIDAYGHAATLRPNDVTPRLRVVEVMLQGLPATAHVPPRALAELREIERISPDEPAALWYLGLAAAQDKDLDSARRYWTALRAVLPPDSENARTVNAALDALKGR